MMFIAKLINYMFSVKTFLIPHVGYLKYIVSIGLRNLIYLATHNKLFISYIPFQFVDANYLEGVIF